MLKECRNKKRYTYTTRFPDGEHILLLLNNMAVNDQAWKANTRWDQEIQWQPLSACVPVPFLTILNKGHYDRPCSAETFLSIPIIFYINNAISPKPNNSHVFKKKLFESWGMPAKTTSQNLIALVSQWEKDKLHSQKLFSVSQNIEFPDDPAILFPGLYSKNLKAGTQIFVHQSS